MILGSKPAKRHGRISSDDSLFKSSLARSIPSLPSSFLPSHRVPNNLRDCKLRRFRERKKIAASPLFSNLYTCLGPLSGGSYRIGGLGFFISGGTVGFGAQDRCFAAVGPGAWHVPFYK